MFRQTVILDCCHSGSGTRSLPVDLSHAPRGAEIPGNIPLNTDSDICNDISPVNGRRHSNLIPGSLESHVLLAACSEGEKAQDDRVNMCGVFTNALLQVLKSGGLDKFTYVDVLKRMDALPQYVRYI